MINLENRIRIARGEAVADLLLKRAKIVNVLSGDIHEEDVAIAHGRIVGFGDYKAKEIIDIQGLYLSPGFIDGHIHLESTMVTPLEFAKTVVPLGTTTVVTDPHEIANVIGLDGLRYILKASRNLPLDIYIMLPSCVPATEMETSGAHLGDHDLSLFLGEDRVVGLGEMMNFPGVINMYPEVMRKIRIASRRTLREKKIIDGHAPLLSGKDLNAYISAGIKSDHECTRLEEAREKLRKGMWIMIREGTTEKNMEDILPLVNPANSRRCLFVSDDRHPCDLLVYGHMNYTLKKAVSLGFDPILAIQMVTINPSEYFHLESQGAIAPGYRADLLVLEDLKDFKVKKVFKDGHLVAEDGRLITYEFMPEKIVIRSTMNLDTKGIGNLKVRAEGDRIKVIEVIPGQIHTRKRIEKGKVTDGEVVSDIERDILKIAVFERHMASGNFGIGFVKGFGLKRGAIASSVAHDSHNLIVVGVNDREMEMAVMEVIRMKGGQVVVADGEAIASLPLPIAGLISDRSIEEVSQKVKELLGASKEIGCILENPFMAISFLALPVIPELKITDKGLVDVERFKIVPLFGE
jgi:adenine deaminase